MQQVTKMNLQHIAVQACYTNRPKQTVALNKGLHSAQQESNHNN